MGAKTKCLVCIYYMCVFMCASVCVALPYLPVLCERGHSSALCVGLGQAGADLQQVGLAWLGDHHGVVEGGSGGALDGVLLLPEPAQGN